MGGSLGSNTETLEQLRPTPMKSASSGLLPPVQAQNESCRRKGDSDRSASKLCNSNLSSRRGSTRSSTSMNKANLDDAILVDLSNKLPTVVRQTCTRVDGLTKTLRELHLKSPLFFTNVASYNALVNICFEAMTGQYYFAKWQNELT